MLPPMSQPFPHRKNFLVPYIATQILSTIYGPSPSPHSETTPFNLRLEPDFALQGIYGHSDLNQLQEPTQPSVPLASFSDGWFVPNDMLQTLMSRIHQGIIPDLIELVCSFPLDVDPLNAQQQLRQCCHTLSQAGPMGLLRGEELRLALGFRSRKAQYKHLQVLEQTANPMRQQHIQHQKNALLNLMDELENALIEKLSEDPCLGKEMFLNKEQKAYPGWIQKVMRGFSTVRKLFGAA